jgi:hypothetical protein
MIAVKEDNSEKHLHPFLGVVKKERASPLSLESGEARDLNEGLLYLGKEKGRIREIAYIYFLQNIFIPLLAWRVIVNGLGGGS